MDACYLHSKNFWVRNDLGTEEENTVWSIKSWAAEAFIPNPDEYQEKQKTLQGEGYHTGLLINIFC